MNILQINNTDTKGGAAKVAWRLKENLHQNGHEATMLVAKKYSYSKDVHLIRPYSVWRERVMRKLTYWLADDLDFSPAKHIRKMQVYKNADVIHLHNIHSNYFNLSTIIPISIEKPVVWTFHDMWPITPRCAHSYSADLEDGFWQCPSLDIYPPMAWHNEKYLIGRKRKIYGKAKFTIVTPSLWLKEKIEKSILGNRDIRLIYNGVDTNIFNPVDKRLARHELNLPQDKFIILFLAKRGQSNPWKGGTYAYDIMTSLRGNEKIYFVDLGGDIEYKDESLQRISFVRDESILAKYYSAADILLYPSLADNCPLVVIEAMACGLPVIAFKTGGIPELIRHKETGYTASYEDAEDLVSGIDWFLELSDSERSYIRSRSADSVAANFTIKQMTDKYVGLYRDILSPNSIQ